jgi:outer membrane protein TolC
MSLSRFFLLVLSAPALFYAEPGTARLTLDAALQQAVQTYPALAAQQARVDAARQAQIPAAELPDPRLAIGIDNFPVSGPTAGSLTADFMTMQRIGVMQDVTNTAKRRARRESAEARVAQAGAEQRAVRRMVQRDTALAWIARLAVEKKLTQFARLEQENRLLAETVRARIASGQARLDEALMPRQEAMKLADQRDELVSQQQQARAVLQRWMGRTDDTAMDDTWPGWPVERSVLQARLHQHPELAVFVPRDQVLAAEMREAEAAKHPDWGVALVYQRRGQQFGDMVSAELSFDLPIFSARRQDPRIAEKQAERAGLEAEREEILRQHAEELERDFAEYERLEKSVARQRDALLPLLASKLDLLLASYRAGKAGLAEIIAVRAERQAAELQLIEFEGQRSLAAARLHFGYGENAE